MNSKQYNNLSQSFCRSAMSLFFVMVLQACDGSGSGSTDAGNTGGETTGGGTTGGETTGVETTGGDATGGDATGGDGELSPLPDPSLTAAPSQDDEPLVESSDFNTASGVTVYREPGERLPVEETVDLTEADFLAGPLPAKQTVPDNVDPTVNSAPYFDNLEDQEIFAGELLEVLFKPVDPDGDVPGMFPEKVPEGASFVDNLNGTKTLRWLPLQRDVGIREFTATAIDALNSQYRTERTIRIKIKMPADPSTIPNVPPRLQEQVAYTIRVNDPVVIEFTGIDLNGPFPIVEIPDLPAGATFNQHLRYDEIYVLKFIPTEVGLVNINVVVRDAVDSTLTANESVSLNIRDSADFVRSGQRLRELAANRGIKIGFASRYEFYHRPDSRLYTEIAAQEFDIVTPETSLKMDYINPTPGRYQFAETDNVVNYAMANNMTVHGHPLVWHRLLPEWILNSAIADREVHMREYIDRIVSRYGDSIGIWDVVNEPLDDNGGFRNSVWFEGMGIDYIDIAFRQAKESAPDSIRLLNEYDIAMNGPKSTALFPLLDSLIEKETPIDGVGFQLHIWTNFTQFDDVRANFQKVADRGLDVYVTELDVSMAEGGDETLQATVYQKILEICLEQPRCKAFQTWGFTDQYSWRRNFTPLLFDDAYQPKPAYTILQNTLAGSN